MATAEVINISQPHVSAPPESAMIHTSDLWKTYDMGSEQQVHALRGVNLSIRRNEYAASMGPSGSGKSSAVMAGLFVPVGGVLIEAVIQVRYGLRAS